MNLTFQLKPADDYNEPRSINIILISESAIFLICKRHLLIVRLQIENIIMMIKIIIMITITVIIVMLNILYHLILKVFLWSHMKIVYYIVISRTTFTYIYNIRNNFIVTEQLNVSPTKYLIFYWFGLYFQFCFLPLI